MRLDTFRASVRAALFLGVTCFLIVTYPLACAFGLPGRHMVRRFWSRFSCRLMGIRVSGRGVPFTACPTLLVPNHVSYLDILVLGTLSDATFIAKSEVDGWPLFGYIARTTGTLFIKRHWRQAKIQRDTIIGRMRDQEESFVLFAEGTSSNGLGVKPFKTALLSVVEPWVLDRAVAVQPVTLAYTELSHGEPFTATTCDAYAWYDEMPFLPHLWDVLKRPGMSITVQFHEPVLSWQVASRKQLGPAMRAEIATRLEGLREELVPAQRRPAAQIATDLPQPAE